MIVTVMAIVLFLSQYSQMTAALAKLPPAVLPESLVLQMLRIMERKR